MSPRDFDKESRLPRFSLDRRITVLVLALTLALVGVISTMGIPIELFPRGYAEPSLWVSVPWADAPAREVMDKLAIPLEEEFGTIKGLDTVTSVSLTGVCRVFMRFKQGTDMDIAYREVRDRVERARVRFPDDIDQVFINKDDLSGVPVYMVGIAIDPQAEDPYNLIKNGVMLPLERVDGVASIDSFGLEEKEILIEVDREKASAAGLNIYELTQGLSDDNFSMASGNVHSGAKKLLMRSIATYASLEALENRLLNDSIRLRDVAAVRYEEPEKDYAARVNGKPAVALHILKEAEANTHAVCERLDEEFKQIQNDPRLALLDMDSFFNQGDIIDESLSTLGISGLVGGLLAAGVLFVFMRRFRLTLIVALSIPLSLVLGVTVMYFAGETLNILTLIGLMICVGLLVDNSVVVAENIHRLNRDGLERRDACIRGAGEVGLAITMSTLTTIIVFMPAALVEGDARFFLLRLAVPVAVSVAGSLLIALVCIPLAVYLTLPSTAQAASQGGIVRRWHEWINRVLRRFYEAVFGRLNRLYNRILGIALSRRFDTALLITVLFAGTMAASRNIEWMQQQDDEQNFFEMIIEFPDNHTLEETAEYVEQAEQVVDQYMEEWGLDGYFVFHRKTFAFVQGWFKADRDTGVTAKQATEILAEELPKPPGVEVRTGSDRQGADDDEPGTHVVFLQGDDPDALEDMVENLEDLLVQVDGVTGLKKSARQTNREIALVVDRDKAQHYDVNPEVIAGVVGYALRGNALPKYNADGREIPVRVRFREEDRESLTELESFEVPTQQGEFLPLSSIAQPKVLPTSQVIVRRDKSIGRTITLQLEQDRESETRAKLATLMAAIDLPEGMSFGTDRSQQDLDNEFAGLLFAVILSIVFIYLLMGFLFESFMLPLSIVVTIPLSLIGVIWIHLATGRNIDFLGAVAIILLIGVVVNNGIVLVDYINRLRGKGMSRRDAVLRATDLRFRPIMMTAITTIGGMVPLALAGASSIGLSYTSFALTLIGGMSTATLLTLLVVPITYTLFDDLRSTVGAAVRSTGRRPAGRAQETAAG